MNNHLSFLFFKARQFWISFLRDNLDFIFSKTTRYCSIPPLHWIKHLKKDKISFLFWRHSNTKIWQVYYFLQILYIYNFYICYIFYVFNFLILSLAQWHRNVADRFIKDQHFPTRYFSDYFFSLQNSYMLFFDII